jgi:hypothetical protein
MADSMGDEFGQTADMFYALAAIFTTLFAAVFGFASWDKCIIAGYRTCS